MNFSRRHFLLGAAGAAAAAGLTACGGNNGGLSTGGGSSTGTAGQKPTLSQWYHQYGEAGTEAAVKRYAAAYTAATVNVKWNPGNYDSMVPTALLSNSFPDVFEYANGPTLDMIKAGQVSDLTDVVGSAASTFNQAVMKRLTFQGKIWAIPQNIDMQMLYYRKSLLAKAKVAPPTTFAGLVAAANAVKSKTVGGFFAGNDGGVGVLGNMFIWAAGLDQLDANRTKAAFLEPGFYSALTQYRDFLDGGGVLQAASKDWYDGSPFANGETAMQWGGLWSLTQIKQALGDDFGVLPFPAIGSTGRPAVPFGSYSSCVAAKGANVEAAKAFVKWLWIDREDYQVDFANSYGDHLVAKPSLTSKATKTASGPGKDAAGFVADHGFASDIMWTGALGTAFSSAVTNVIKKKADPQKEFASMASLAVSELKRANS